MADKEKPLPDTESTTQQILILKTIIPKLNELGVSKLTVNYSWSGDEGSIDGIDVEPEGLVIPDELEERISDLADEFLYSEHGSWGDGDGVAGRGSAPADQDFSISADWSQITEYDYYLEQDDGKEDTGSWSSTTYCLKDFRYEKCGEKSDVVPPNPRTLKDL